MPQPKLKSYLLKLSFVILSLGSLATLLYYRSELFGFFRPSTDCHFNAKFLDRELLLHSPRTNNGCANLQSIWRAVQSELQRIEITISSKYEASEIANFNRAKAGQSIFMSADTLALIRIARQYYDATQASFDITLSPIIDAWKDATERDSLPKIDDLQSLRQDSDWSSIHFQNTSLLKTNDQTQLNLNAFLKGYGIDRACFSLQNAGVQDGHLEISGNRRVFGNAMRLTLSIEDLNDPGKALLHYQLENAAAASAGNPKRHILIEQQRYSHMIDGRSLWPSKARVQSTVVANSAMLADVWATALAVLASPGLDLLPNNIAAFLIIDENNRRSLIGNAAFKNLTLESFTDDIEWRVSTEPSP